MLVAGERKFLKFLLEFEERGLLPQFNVQIVPYIISMTQLNENVRLPDNDFSKIRFSEGCSCEFCAHGR